MPRDKAAGLNARQCSRGQDEAVALQSEQHKEDQIQRNQHGTFPPTEAVLVRMKSNATPMERMVAGMIRPDVMVQPAAETSAGAPTQRAL